MSFALERPNTNRFPTLSTSSTSPKIQREASFGIRSTGGCTIAQTSKGFLTTPFGAMRNPQDLPITPLSGIPSIINTARPQTAVPRLLIIFGSCSLARTRGRSSRTTFSFRIGRIPTTTTTPTVSRGSTIIFIACWEWASHRVLEVMAPVAKCLTQRLQGKSMAEP